MCACYTSILVTPCVDFLETGEIDAEIQSDTSFPTRMQSSGYLKCSVMIAQFKRERIKLRPIKGKVRRRKMRSRNKRERKNVVVSDSSNCNDSNTCGSSLSSHEFEDEKECSYKY